MHGSKSSSKMHRTSLWRSATSVHPRQPPQIYDPTKGLPTPYHAILEACGAVSLLCKNQIS